MSRQNERIDRVVRWQLGVGDLLRCALCRIKEWANEGEPTEPRDIGFYELLARANGDLEFDGTGYIVTEGFANLVADLATSRNSTTYTDPFGPAVDEEEIPGSTIAYSLACRIAELNHDAEYPLPDSLRYFVPGSDGHPKNPRGRGYDGESRVLRDKLSAWAIQRGIDLGLKPSRNQEPFGRNALRGKIPCAADLVESVFKETGWDKVSYDTVLSAFTDLHYREEFLKDRSIALKEKLPFLRNKNKSIQRRLLKSTNSAVIERQYAAIDDALERLEKCFFPDCGKN